MDISIAIKKIRKSKKISQENLALKSGVSRQHMYKIENNKCDIRVGTLEKLALILEVKVSEIILLAEEIKN